MLNGAMRSGYVNVKYSQRDGCHAGDARSLAERSGANAFEFFANFTSQIGQARKIEAGRYANVLKL